MDGTVEEGRSSVDDESLVTGESMPVTKSEGDRVLGGTINSAGSLVVVADAVGRDTMLSRIVTMVAEAQRSRHTRPAPGRRGRGRLRPRRHRRRRHRLRRVGPGRSRPRLAHALVVAVAVLIIACPCALGLATPMSIMVGVGRVPAQGS